MTRKIFPALVSSDDWMTAEQAAALRKGDKVLALLPGCGHVFEGGEEVERYFASGDVLTVAEVREFPPDRRRRTQQGTTVTVFHESGVVNVFDEGDYGGMFPLKRYEVAGGGPTS